MDDAARQDCHDGAPSTADPEVDRIIGTLEAVTGAALGDQFALLDTAHQQLQRRLAESDGASR